MATDGKTLGKSYDPGPIEEKWYGRWTEGGLFRGDAESQKPSYCIVIPPPNVTGSLHMGHALNNTLQDISCRYMRMKGKNVLWLPGTDHAGIATQNVVEKNLSGKGISRHDLGRDAFVEKIWEWKKEYGSRIINQLKRLGASCDWERERFTMDDGLSRAVRSVFVRLYKEGLIYRGKYIINWCPRCQTALSDLEVEHHEEKGKLFHVRYPLEGEEGYLVVATTRPETILGDVAIAVHPRDEKNSSLAGKFVKVPVTGRVIPVIEDNMVDPAFGTGLVKITPAHDPNDFLVGNRHGLEAIQVIDEHGVMNEEAGAPFTGLDRFEARTRMVNVLEKEDLLEKIEEHDNAIGHCYRCDCIVEPYLSEQWFVRTEPLAKPGIEAVRDGRINIVPSQWESTYNMWMENIRDWCISRQLWWGHRIPAWTCSDCGHLTVSEEDPTACEACGSSRICQDEDVLDTWFSSALWPFSTLGWPDKTKELETFYPTSLLVTGFDILFFWVARMIMMGLRFMDKEPFTDVYIHALVRDEHGQKMSKSRGNVIDPLEIIEKSGSDSLRMTLAALTVQGRDIFLGPERIEVYRLFMNKIWNASKFALANLDGEKCDPFKEGTALRTHDRWILERLAVVTENVTRDLDGYFYGEAARSLYQFVWNEICDWYLEMAKPSLRGDEGEDRGMAARAVLELVFSNIFRLLHPFIPFLTEELWEKFGFGNDFIEKEEWPVPKHVPGGSSSVDEMEIFQEAVRNARNLRAEARMHPQQEIREVVINLSDKAGVSAEVLGNNADLFCLLVRTAVLRVNPPGSTRPPRSLMAVCGFGEVFLVAGDLLDAVSEVTRLEGELAKAKKDLERSTAKLSDSSFISRAPAEIVEKEKARVSASEEKILLIERNIESLSRQ
ncbi:MAG TPA: valine--tRNA ligase [Synergistales bacterium]|nr:valine--tRNA ligase [Synergistales bacterium]HRV71258.1 valine--tRNA ligase [Thermovirgaceae bacterium]